MTDTCPVTGRHIVFDLGWCHNCMTFQRRADAPRRVMSWWPDAGPLLSCVVCPDEPWGMGVWNAAPGKVDAERLVLIERHAIAQDSFYPGDCACGCASASAAAA